MNSAHQKGQTDHVILDFCSKIEDLYFHSIVLIGQKGSKIESDERLRYLTSFSVVLFGYLNEIAFLQKHNHNTSLEPLLRDSLECYSFIKEIEENFDDFDDYKKFLILTDLEQDMKIYADMQSVVTKSQKLKDEIKNLIDRVKNRIKAEFPQEFAYFQNDEIAEIKQLITAQSKLIPFKNNITDRVNNAVPKNEALKNDNNGNPHESASSIYRNLCSSTHCNLSSIENRIIDPVAKKVQYNYSNKYVNRGDMCVAYYTGKEVLRILNDLLQRD